MPVRQKENNTESGDKADPGGYGLENGAMDAEQEHGKAGEEEKKGDME